MVHSVEKSGRESNQIRKRVGSRFNRNRESIRNESGVRSQESIGSRDRNESIRRRDEASQTGNMVKSG